MRMKGIRSLREMTRLLDSDHRLGKLCLIKKDEKGYLRSVLSRFIRKVGEDKLNKIIEEKVIKLLKSNTARDFDAVLNASLIKAWSTRYPIDSQKGYSDAEVRVGRVGRVFSLGYKLHLSVDTKSMLSLANVFASANQNEKKHSLQLVEKTRRILSNAKAKIRSVIADSQYSDGKLILQTRNVKSRMYFELIGSLELMDRVFLRQSNISGLRLRQFTVF